MRGAPEIPFTPYKTFQTTIAAIEKLSQLTFTGTRGASRMSLGAFDPLTKQRERPRLENVLSVGRPGKNRLCRSRNSARSF